jgi:hypothetical protein
LQIFERLYISQGLQYKQVYTMLLRQI